MTENSFSISYLQRIFIILIVLTSGTTIAIDLSIPMYLLTAVFILMVMLRQINIGKEGGRFLYIIFIVSLWFMQYLMPNGDTLSLEVILKVSMVFFMMFMYTGSKHDQNIERFDFFIKVIFVFSIISNIIFVALLIGLPLPVFKSSVGGTYSVLYIEQYFLSGSYGVLGYRNSGIYWEPGMYQIYLNLMLIYYLYHGKIEERKKIFVVIYLILSIVTTGSVTGYALCAVLMVLYAVNNSNSHIFKLIAVVTTGIGLYFIYPYMESMLNTKMNIGTSYTTRLSDLTFGWDVFKSSPIWGHGINSTAYSDYYLTRYGLSRGNTNGMIAILLQFGIIGTVIYLKHMGGFCVWLKKKYSAKILLPIIVWALFSFNTEPISNHTAIFFLLGIGMSYYREKNVVLFIK